MRKIGILGAGAHARETADWMTQSGYIIESFFATTHGGEINIKNRGKISVSDTIFSELDYVIGVGDVNTKKILVDIAKENKALFVKEAYHTSVVLGTGVKIGEGSFIAPFCVVTNNTCIGEFVTVNIGSTISHDCTIGDFTTLAPQVCIGGYVTVGSGVNIGIGSHIRDRINVSNGVKIGMGSVVVKDALEIDATYLGCPAQQRIP